MGGASRDTPAGRDDERRLRRAAARGDAGARERLRRLRGEAPKPPKIPEPDVIVGNKVVFTQHRGGPRGRDLVITFSPWCVTAREELLAIKESRLRAMDELHEAFEDILVNSDWRLVEAGDLGGLSEAPVLCRDIDYDDMGDITRVGHAYAYLDYQVRCPLEELLEKGRVVFKCVDDE